MSWVVFSALTIVLAFGAGLAVRRLCGAASVPLLLLLPLGLAALVVVAGAFCYAAPLAPLAAPACVVLGALGFVLERKALMRVVRRRSIGLDPWALSAAIGAWAVLAAPIVLSGKPGFTGYAHIVDISYEFDLAAHFAHSGRSVPPSTLSAYRVVLAKYLGTGYPGGGPWTLGALSNLTPIDLSWLYQPFLAFLSAMTALSAYSLLGRAIDSRRWRAFGAFIAAQPNILVGYALGGGIKELGTVCFLLLLAACLALELPRFAPGRGLLTISLSLAATVAFFSLTTLPWVGVLCVGASLSAVAFQPERKRSALAIAQIGGLAFAPSIPTLAAAFKLLPVVTGRGPVDLGNLAAPIPVISAAGVWITGDIRFPQYAHHLPSELIAGVVLALGALGAIYAVRRRSWSVVWLGIAGIVAVYYVAQRYGPWIQFKSQAITSPIALLLAFTGVGALMRVSGRTIIGAIPAIIVGGGVLAGNALLYHNVTLAPYARLHNLQYIGERFAHQGPTLTPDFEEYAEYYLRDSEQTSMVNGPTPELRPGVNRANEPGGIFSYDINEYSFPWLESFRTIVMRRNPVASRPPSNYRLVYLSDYYEVWQRQQRPARIYAHLAGVGLFGGNPTPVCNAAVAGARTLPGASIAFTLGPPPGAIALNGTNTSLSGAFRSVDGTIIAEGAGRAVGTPSIPAPGRYAFFLNGSFGRPVNLSVDGRHVGTAAYQISYPDQPLKIGTLTMSQGPHRVVITRGGFGLHPGNGDGIDRFTRTVGQLLMVPVASALPVLHFSTVTAFRPLCRARAPLRWVEIVRQT